MNRRKLAVFFTETTVEGPAGHAASGVSFHPLNYWTPVRRAVAIKASLEVVVVAMQPGDIAKAGIWAAKGMPTVSPYGGFDMLDLDTVPFVCRPNAPNHPNAPQ